MNTQIQQQTNRVVKGQEIANDGLVSRLEKDIFLVKNQYEVQILDENEPILACSCDDFLWRNEQYNCKHIIAVLFYMMDN